MQLADDDALNWILADVDPASFASIRQDMGLLRSQGRIRILHAEAASSDGSSRAGLILQLNPATDSIRSTRILFMRALDWATNPHVDSQSPSVHSSPKLPPKNAAWAEVLQQLLEYCASDAVESVIATPPLIHDSSAGVYSRDSLENAGFRPITRIHQLWIPTCESTQEPRLHLSDEFEVERSHALRDSDRELMSLIAETSDDPTIRYANESNAVCGSSEANYFCIRSSRGVHALMVLQPANGLSGEIVYIGVAPEHRRQRFASVLIREAIRFASEAKWDGVTVATTENNSSAMRLYLRAGFQLVQRFELMELRLRD